MPFPVDFFFLLILTLLFNQNYAGIFREIEKSNSENLPQYYSRMRNTNVYRGVLLAKSFEEKKEICVSMFDSQPFKNAEVWFIDSNLYKKSGSGETSVDKSLGTLVVKEMMHADHLIAKNEIFVTCTGTDETEDVENLEKVVPQIDLYFASFAFETNVFFISQVGFDPSSMNVLTDFKLTMPPEIGLQNEYQIREIYLTTRGNIEVLRKESPKYVEMIEERDDIQSLSEADQFLICGSILTSPYYLSQNVEVDLEWIEKGGRIEIYNRPITFLNENGTRNELLSQNILCNTHRSGSQDTYHYYYTRSYNNQNSVFFLKTVDSDLIFDTYVKNIYTLMNAQKRLRHIQTATTS